MAKLGAYSGGKGGRESSRRTRRESSFSVRAKKQGIDLGTEKSSDMDDRRGGVL